MPAGASKPSVGCHLRRGGGASWRRPSQLAGRYEPRSSTTRCTGGPAFHRHALAVGTLGPHARHHARHGRDHHDTEQLPRRVAGVARTQVRACTFQGYMFRCNACLRPGLGDCLVGELTVPQLNLFFIRPTFGRLTSPLSGSLRESDSKRLHHGWSSGRCDGSSCWAARYAIRCLADRLRRPHFCTSWRTHDAEGSQQP